MNRLIKKIIIVLVFVLIGKFSDAQSWIQKNNTYGAISGCSTFAINDTGYVVAGAGNGTWMYDTLVDSWVQEANYPGVQGGVKVGFAIDGMGYVGTGTAAGCVWFNEFYQYNPKSNTWTPEANFSGLSRAYAVAFVLDGKGYVGCGVGSPGTSCGGTNFHAYKDFYAYDPSNNMWTQIANYPGKGSQFNISFVIGDKAYVGCGETIDSSNWGVTAIDSDFWEYDTISKVWTRIANFAGGPRAAGTGFSTCGNGFVGLGYSDIHNNDYMNDFWQYNPTNNTWTPIANYGGAARALASSFIINNSAWVGMGFNNSQNFDDWWEYHVVYTPGFTANSSVCQGDSVLFTDTSSYSPDHWYWQFPGATPDTSTKQNPKVVYNTAGSHNVILTAWNSCDSATKLFTNYITITAGPAVSVTPDSPSVCNGQHITLVANGGMNYRWVGTPDTTDSISVNPSIDTAYELMVANGTCSRDTFISVHVRQAPALIIQPPSPASVCLGQTIVLIVPVSGTNYMWSPSSTLSSSTADTVVSTPLTQTTYVVTGIDSLGCAVTSDSEVVMINTGPSKPTITQHDSALISSSTQSNQWLRNDTIINGATNQDYIVATVGYYQVTVSNPANGCSTTSDSVHVVPSGINQLTDESGKLMVYPNPTNGEIVVNISSSVGEIKDWNLQITDVLGRTVYNKQSLNYSNDIDLSDFSSGVYFIAVINKTGRVVVPVVKQN